MKWLIAILIILFFVLQYKLWFERGGVGEVWQLQQQIVSQQQANTSLKDRNRVLLAEVNNLKQGQQAIAARARTELGMVKRGEVFYQIIKPAAPRRN